MTSAINQTEKEIADCKIFRVMERVVTSSDTKPLKRFYLHSGDWCNIIPVTEHGTLVMVKQHRAGINKETLEFPGGMIDPEDPQNVSAALREMKEETGYAPLGGVVPVSLGWCHPNPAILNNRAHSFIVGPVRKVHEPRPDDDEKIETVEVSIPELFEIVRNGILCHALMRVSLTHLLFRSDKALDLVSETLKGYSRPTV